MHTLHSFLLSASTFFVCLHSTDVVCDFPNEVIDDRSVNRCSRRTDVLPNMFWLGHEGIVVLQSAKINVEPVVNMLLGLFTIWT